ncbi:MAG: ABC transporter substrate-binding protein [Chloroflexi bacterium]|nr:ABC transporter substrate-binding protein [Chloroflexota bacterium]
MNHDEKVDGSQDSVVKRAGLSRRRFLAGGATGLLAAALTGCRTGLAQAVPTPAAGRPSITGAPEPSNPGQPFTMFVYSGLTERAYRELFVPGFERETGARVTLDPGWWDMAAKLKVAPSGQATFDLVMTDSTQGYPGIRDNLFTKIDLDNVPNARRFAPPVLESWIYRDGWGVPYVSSAMTLAWHKELVPGSLKSWGDLFADSLKGEIMLYNAWYMSLFTFAAAKAALDGKPNTARQQIETDLDAVLQFAREKRDWVKYWWPATSDAVFALMQRNVKAGNLHGNGLIQPLKEGRPLDLVIPKEDRAYVQLFFLVPRNTRDRRLAEQAIDFIASPGFQRDLAEKTGELSCNIPEVAAEVAKSNPIWARVYPHSAEDWQSLAYYPFDAYDRQLDKIVNVWNREILRKG